LSVSSRSEILILILITKFCLFAWFEVEKLPLNSFYMLNSVGWFTSSNFTLFFDCIFFVSVYSGVSINIKICSMTFWAKKICFWLITTKREKCFCPGFSAQSMFAVLPIELLQQPRNSNKKNSRSFSLQSPPPRILTGSKWFRFCRNIRRVRF
jgi:hypothetical protein